MTKLVPADKIIWEWRDMVMTGNAEPEKPRVESISYREALVNARGK
jgi:hypothetical protein